MRFGIRVEMEMEMQMEMQKVGRLATVGLAASLIAMVVGCGPEGEDTEVPAAAGAEGGDEVAAAVSPATAQAVASVARPVATELVRTLSGNLTTAMQESGPVGAMEFCNVQALPLTEQVSEEQGLEVKRTSWRLRNPANEPDELERAALRHFEPVRAAGAEAEPWVQRDPDGGWRYYQPLPTGEACLNCHGAPESLAPGVADALTRLYPNDEATGFELGSLRGILRVAVPEEAVEITGG